MRYHPSYAPAPGIADLVARKERELLERATRERSNDIRALQSASRRIMARAFLHYMRTHFAARAA